ncbi:MAG: choice-of-anchor B family protein, partial [Gemmatimonadales bacterium]
MNWKRSISCALVATAMAAAPAAAQFGGNYGSAIAIGEGELFIGEPLDNYNPGLVHVFRMDGGTWKAAETLSAEDAAPDNSFGRSISVDGNTMLIGATTADSLRGAAYVFHKSGGEWSQTAKLEGSDITAGDALGKVVLLNGEEAFVATWGKDSGQGAVYVFRKSGNSWAEAGVLSPDDGEPEDRFGSALATDGERLYIGAAGRDSSRGAVYVFHNEAGTWAQDTVLQGRRLEPESELGTSLLVRDNHLLAGLPGMNNHSGAVGIVERDTASGTWSEVALLQPFEGGYARFGTDVATNGDEVWVSAPAANRGSGAIYRLQRNAEGGFAGAVKIQAPDLPRRAGFGAPIVVKGDVVVAGAGGVDYGEGAAVILTAAGDDWEVASVLKGEVRSLAAITGDEMDCGSEGSVSIFECRRVDLLSFLPVSAIGGTRGIRLNDIWGWTDPETKREYALVGRMDGTSFVDVTDPVNPKYLGDLPMTEGAIANAWRDIKVYKNHAFIVADGAGDHGMQVFDLTRLRAVKGDPVTFTADALYDEIH